MGLGCAVGAARHGHVISIVLSHLAPPSKRGFFVAQSLNQALNPFHAEHVGHGTLRSYILEGKREGGEHPRLFP